MLSRGETLSEFPSASARAASALDVRFEALRPRLTGLAASLVGADAAEDVVHDAYLRARDRLGQLHDRGALDSWFTRIVVRTAYNHHRRRAGLARLLPVLADRGTAAVWDLGLRELIERLPARDRVVLVLHYAHGYDLGEVAKLIGTSHANARQIASRARRRLALAWEQADE
jgi:RNA polymerase sigma-70 factor (ECF subfamily)